MPLQPLWLTWTTPLDLMRTRSTPTPRLTRTKDENADEVRRLNEFDDGSLSDGDIPEGGPLSHAFCRENGRSVRDGRHWWPIKLPISPASCTRTVRLSIIADDRVRDPVYRADDV